MSNFISRLFGSRKPSRPMRDVAALVKPLAVPAMHVITVRQASRSHLGGDPSMPGDVAWPQYQGKKMQFLARLSLSELQAVLAIEWLPKSGALLFFYDSQQRTWGFDPKDRGSWAVLHVPDLANAESGSASRISGDVRFHRPVRFRPIEVYPAAERAAVAALDLSDEELEAYGDLARAAFHELPEHQIGGLPDPIQVDGMELECQLASNGIYVGDGKGYEDPRVATLKAGEADWRLLLQLDTDEDLGFKWGDGGRLYFWVQESEARAGRFENAWMVLQCT